MNKIMIAVMLIMLTACSTGTSVDNSRSVADKYVRSLYQYQAYNGYNLKRTAITSLDCTSCYVFTYEFDVHTNLPIKHYRVDVPVQNGIIGNVVMDQTGSAVDP